MHGDETVGRELLLKLIDLICTSYNNQDDGTELAPIDRSILGYDLRTKRGHDTGVTLGTRRVYGVGHAVRINDVRPFGAEHAPNLALAAGNTARKANGDHSLSIGRRLDIHKRGGVYIGVPKRLSLLASPPKRAPGFMPQRCRWRMLPSTCFWRAISPASR